MAAEAVELPGLGHLLPAPCPGSRRHALPLSLKACQSLHACSRPSFSTRLCATWDLWTCNCGGVGGFVLGSRCRAD